MKSLLKKMTKTNKKPLRMSLAVKMKQNVERQRCQSVKENKDKKRHPLHPFSLRSRETRDTRV